MSAQPQIIKWWQWHTVQRKLELWAKSLLRVPARYSVAFTTAIPTARQSSRLRCIEVNPEAFGGDDREQYAATCGLLAHEVGHANYSEPPPQPWLLQKLVGGLEDERVERCEFGDTSPVPRALIAGLQGATCSQVMPTLEPMFEALTARPEEIKVLLLLHDGLAHDPDELTSWVRQVRCISGFFFWGIYLGNNPQEEAAMRGLLGMERLIACREKLVPLGW